MLSSNKTKIQYNTCLLCIVQTILYSHSENKSLYFSFINFQKLQIIATSRFCSNIFKFGHKISNNIWNKGSLEENVILKFYYFGPVYYIGLRLSENSEVDTLNPVQRASVC